MDRHPGLRRLSIAILSGLLAGGAVAGCDAPNPSYRRPEPKLDDPSAMDASRIEGGPGGDAAPGFPDPGQGGDGPPAEPPPLLADGAPPPADAAPPSDGPLPDAPLPADAGPLPADAAPLPPDTAPLPPDTAPLPPDAAADRPPDSALLTARYHFEQSTQSWGNLRPAKPSPPTISRSNVRAWDGQYSLRADLRSGTSIDATHTLVGIAQEFTSQLPPGTRITYRLWLPAGSGLEYVQPFVLYYQAGDAPGNPGWGGIDPPLFVTGLVTDGWNTITHRVPSDSDSRGVVEVGLEFVMRTSSSLTVYIDAVTW